MRRRRRSHIVALGDDAIALGELFRLLPFRRDISANSLSRQAARETRMIAGGAPFGPTGSARAIWISRSAPLAMSPAKRRSAAKIVAAERNDQEIDRRVAAQARRQVVGAAPVGLDRIVEHGGAPVETFLDHRQAGPSSRCITPVQRTSAETARLRRARNPSVGIAEGDDDSHGSLDPASRRL